VGKSSLLNFLVARKGLARVSSTPGRTRLLNFFEVAFSSGDSLWLVDLPGYGFAKMPTEAKRAFGPMIEGYLQKRDTLRALALLIDIRRGAEEEEAQVISYAEARGLPVLLLVTKSDQLPKAKRFPRAEEIRTTLGLRRRPILTSVNDNLGREDAWRALCSLALPKPTPEPASAPEPVSEPGEPVR
jgi:GTP-binding protein